MEQEKAPWKGIQMTTRKVIGYLALATLAWATGCRSQYEITTRSHNKISCIGKPVYDHAHEIYLYKDANGVTQVIPALNVSTIGPYERDSRDKFTPAQR